MSNSLATNVMMVGAVLLVLGGASWFFGWLNDVYIMGFHLRSSLLWIGFPTYSIGAAVIFSRQKTTYERVECRTCRGTGKSFNPLIDGKNCPECYGFGYKENIVGTQQFDSWDLGDSSDLGGIARIVGIAVASLWAVSLFTGWFSGATFLGFHVSSSLFTIGLLSLIAGYFPDLLSVGFFIIAALVLFLDSHNSQTGEAVSFFNKAVVAGIIVVIGLYIPRFFLKVRR